MCYSLYMFVSHCKASSYGVLSPPSYHALSPCIQAASWVLSPVEAQLATVPSRVRVRDPGAAHRHAHLALTRQPQYQHLPQVPPHVAPRAVGGRHELLVDAVAVELQRDAGLGHPLYVPSEVSRVARAAAQLQAEAGQRGPRLSLSCGSSSSGSEAALIVRHITRVANKCCINKYLVTWLTMSSHSDEAPLSVGVHGEHQGQLHAGVRPGCRGTS